MYDSQDTEDLRGLLDRAADPRPDVAVEPVTAAQDDLRRGRRALRRRRTLAAGGAACGVALVAGAAFVVPGLAAGTPGSVNGGWAGGGGSTATPTQAPSVPDDPSGTMTPTAAPSATPVPEAGPRSADVEPTVPAGHHTRSVLPSDDPEVSSGGAEAHGTSEPAAPAVPKSPVDHVDDVLDDHLPGRFEIVGHLGDDTDRGIVWGAWNHGDARGTVAAAVLDAGSEWFDAGPDGEPCALRPVKWDADGETWDSCAAEDLPDGDTLFVAEGEDGGGAKRAVSLLTDDGVLVSVSTSVAYFERDPSGSAPVPALDELPVDVETLRDIATDPAMLDG